MSQKTPMAQAGSMTMAGSVARSQIVQIPTAKAAPLMNQRSMPTIYTRPSAMDREAKAKAGQFREVS